MSSAAALPNPARSSPLPAPFAGERDPRLGSRPGCFGASTLFLDDKSVRDSGLGIRVARIANSRPEPRGRNSIEFHFAAASDEETETARILRVSRTCQQSFRIATSRHGNLECRSSRTFNSLTRFFPRDERFGLTSQLRRAAGDNPPSLVAEGHRQGTRAYRHYVVRALGSQAECETQLELARGLGLVDGQRVETSDQVRSSPGSGASRSGPGASQKRKSNPESRIPNPGPGSGPRLPSPLQLGQFCRYVWQPLVTRPRR